MRVRIPSQSVAFTFALMTDTDMFENSLLPTARYITMKTGLSCNWMTTSTRKGKLGIQNLVNVKGKHSTIFIKNPWQSTVRKTDLWKILKFYALKRHDILKKYQPFFQIKYFGHCILHSFSAVCAICLSLSFYQNPLTFFNKFYTFIYFGKFVTLKYLSMQQAISTDILSLQNSP